MINRVYKRKTALSLVITVISFIGLPAFTILEIIFFVYLCTKESLSMLQWGMIAVASLAAFVCMTVYTTLCGKFAYLQSGQKIHMDEDGLSIKIGKKCLELQWSEVKEAGIVYEGATLMGYWYRLYFSKEVLTDRERVNTCTRTPFDTFYDHCFFSFVLPNEEKHVKRLKPHIPVYSHMVDFALQYKKLGGMFNLCPCVYTLDGKKIRHITDDEAQMYINSKNKRLNFCVELLSFYSLFGYGILLLLTVLRFW